MPIRHGNQITIFHAMGIIAAAGGILGLIAANREDLDAIGASLFAPLVIVVPVHFAIEANRRDAIKAGIPRPGDTDG